MASPADMMRAYGVGPTMAIDLALGGTAFAQAVRFFGGLRCWYNREMHRWTLDQKVVPKSDIVHIYRRVRFK